jgi:hypothetical protein
MQNKHKPIPKEQPKGSKNEAQRTRTKNNKIKRLEKEVKRGNLEANKRLEELRNGR